MVEHFVRYKSRKVLDSRRAVSEKYQLQQCQQKGNTKTNQNLPWVHGTCSSSYVLDYSTKASIAA